MDRHRPIHTPNMDVPNRSTIVFVTCCAKDRKRILANQDVMNILLGAWSEADGWLVGRYAVMPDHLHLFCSPRPVDPPPLSAWVRYWKAIASRRWPRIEEQPVWQNSFWDRQLRNGESYAAKASYVDQNPVRHRLVAHESEWSFRGEIHRLIWEEI